VRDIREARDFYCEQIGCAEVMSAADALRCIWGESSIQCCLSSHLRHRVPRQYRLAGRAYSPIPQISVQLRQHEWNALVKRLNRRRIAHTFHELLPSGEAKPGQASLRLFDPSGNLIEVRAAGTAQATSRQRITRRGVWVFGAILVATLGWWLWEANAASRVRADTLASPPVRMASCANWAFC
jgi:extradiol dioxygenase family protein